MRHLNTIRIILNHPLNRGNRIQALLRYLRWQIGSRLVPGPVLFNWVNGSKFLVSHGETGLTMNIYTGLQDFSDMGYVLHVLRPDDLFVDIGANVGSYTILAGASAGANVIAFEPVPETFEKLKTNIILNNLSQKVKCINEGIGKEQDILKFTTDLGPINHALSDKEDRPDCAAVKVDKLDSHLRGMRPFLLKIDVEGYETPVLEGADFVLAQPTLYSVIMELNGSGKRYGFNEGAIVRKMRNYGFQKYSYDPFSRTLSNLNDDTNMEGNTLFIRDYSAVLDRLNQAQPFVVNNSNPI